jgi:hypothetical protein
MRDSPPPPHTPLALTLAHAPGYRCIDEVKQHPFFAGVAWDAVRQAPAPPVVSRPEAGRDDLSLDWELMSLFRQANPAAVKYEYLPSGATV